MNTAARKYMGLKEQYPDAIVMLRVSDFYEVLGADATTVANVCGLVVTSRAVAEGFRLPLVGLPAHSLETYLLSLNRAGHLVVIDTLNLTTA